MIYLLFVTAMFHLCFYIKRLNSGVIITRGLKTRYFLGGFLRYRLGHFEYASKESQGLALLS